MERSGLLVVISHAGYCCKFAIEVQDERPSVDRERRLYASSRSPPRPNTLAQSHLNLSISQIQTDTSKGSPKDRNPMSHSTRTGEVATDLGASQVPARNSQLKRATAFTGYKQPTLRLKFKIKDFFRQVDQKAQSLKRIKRRELLLDLCADEAQLGHLERDLQRLQRALGGPVTLVG